MTLRRRIFVILVIFMNWSCGSQHGRRIIKTRDINTGIEYEIEEVDIPSQDECYQFTWIGVEDDNSNRTDFPTCLNLEESFPTSFGREVPCFHPLVYTVNDENGLNGPIIDEIVEACQRTGSDPFCSRGGGMCVKYTVTDRSKSRVVRWESHFCGQGVKWNGDQVSGTRCFWEDNVEGMDHRVCFSNDGSKCNGSAIVKPLLSVLFIVSYFVFTFL